MPEDHQGAIVKAYRDTSSKWIEAGGEKAVKVVTVRYALDRMINMKHGGG